MNSVACLLERAAARWPANIALEDTQGTLTYGELRRRARAAAAALGRLGLGPGRPAAVFLPKSNACVVSFYAALYCGAPYAPLDYGAPWERIRRTLENLRPTVLITDEAGREKLADFADCAVVDYAALETATGDDAAVGAALDAAVDADPAYIMYTSGSTGTPKGVAVPHRGVLDYAAWLAKLFGFDEHDVMGLQSGFHFDFSVSDLYASVLVGAKMLIIPEALFMYPAKLMEFVRDKRVTAIFWVPTLLSSVADSGVLSELELPDLRTVAFSGEVMPNKQLNIWRRALPHIVCANLYGPTEVTVECACYIADRPFRDEEPLPIGRARPNMRVVILREDGTEAAAGEAGELCVIGSQLALGYWNDPEETARAFAPNPLTGSWPEPMYRTGDLAYREADGLMHFVGRKDSQIKLHSIRVELGDIENAARAIPGVTNACAVFDAANERVVLFAETAQELTLRKFNLALGALLPKYMLPGKLVCMERLPLNANRKIDRAALKASLAEDG